MGILNPFSQTASLAAGDEVLHELFTALGGGGVLHLFHLTALQSRWYSLRKLSPGEQKQLT
jgi:hypothetical protein